MLVCCGNGGKDWAHVSSGLLLLFAIVSLCQLFFECMERKEKKGIFLRQLFSTQRIWQELNSLQLPVLLYPYQRLWR